MDLKRLATWRGGYPFAACLVVLTSLVLLPFRPLLHAHRPSCCCYVPSHRNRGAGCRRTPGDRRPLAVLAFARARPAVRAAVLPSDVAALPEWLGAARVPRRCARHGPADRRAARAGARGAEPATRAGVPQPPLVSQSPPRSRLQPTAEFIASQVTEVLGADARPRSTSARPGASSAECLAQAGDSKPSSGEAALVAWVVRTGAGVGMPECPGLGVEEGVVSRRVGRGGARRQRRRGCTSRCTAHAGLQGCALRPLRRAAASRPSSDDARLLVAVANLAAASLERQRLEEEAAHADVLREADRLKATFVSSISHELKTPLAAATARVTGLVDERETRRFRARAGGARGGLGRPPAPRTAPSATCSTSRAWSPMHGDRTWKHYELVRCSARCSHACPPRSAGESVSSCRLSSTGRQRRLRADRARHRAARGECAGVLAAGLAGHRGRLGARRRSRLGRG